MSAAGSFTWGGVEFDLPDCEKLFHYTNTRGLFGILQSGTLRATHFQFLNDAQECLQAKVSLERQLYGAISRKVAALKVSGKVKFKAGTDIKKCSSEEASNIVDIFYNVLFKYTEPFVFSAFLCGPQDSRKYLHGDLQHWSMYGQEAGYAIQLDPKKLQKLALLEAERFTHGGFLCSKVEYPSGGEQPTSLRKYYEMLENEAARFVEYECLGKSLDELLHEVQDTYIPLVRIISFIKDICFEHEREGRLVFYRHKVVPEGRRNHNLHFSEHCSFGVPYLNLFENTLLGPDCPIERIIIGPHPERIRRRAALEMLLNSKSLNVEIDDSELPYAPRR